MNNLNTMMINELKLGRIPDNYNQPPGSSITSPGPPGSNITSPGGPYYGNNYTYNNYPMPYPFSAYSNPTTPISHKFHQFLANDQSNKSSPNYSIENPYPFIVNSAESSPNPQDITHKKSKNISVDTQSVNSTNFDPTISIISCPSCIEPKQKVYLMPNNNPSVQSLPVLYSPNKLAPPHPFYQKIDENENETVSVLSKGCSVKKVADLEIFPINLANSPLTVYINFNIYINALFILLFFFFSLKIIYIIFIIYINHNFKYI